MNRILHSSTSLALFGAERTREIEQGATASLPQHTLMRRAGQAVAQLALALAPHAQRVWVAAGPGNNGGDGLEAATHLLAAGKRVQVTLLGDAGRMPDDAQDALAHAQAAGVPIGDAAPAHLAAEDIAIDALLGIGASRPPGEALRGLIDQLNNLPCPVLAVDIPSGLHASTGQPVGDACVRAHHTLALLTLKPGLFTASGRDLAGSVWLHDLGVDGTGALPDAWLTGQDAVSTRRRAHTQHKGSFGDVAVVGGATGMTGAAVLAARAAHAAGAGRVYVSLLDGGSITQDLLRPELMFRLDWWKGSAAVLADSTVVCGCGGGDAVREPLPRLLSTAPRLVIDADALNAISTDSSLQSLLRARAERRRFTVLTPHPLEAARLLGCSTAQVQADRLAAARALADGFHCVVLLKGSGSVIAGPGTTSHINPTGNAALATAGTGDVLAGWLGGLWVQRGEALSVQGAMQVACAAAWIHGAAADNGGRAVMRAGDLIEQMHLSGVSPS